MKKILPLVAIFSILLSSCIKYSKPDDNSTPNYPEPESQPIRDTILVDASRDGGIWWSPQSGSPNNHQGTALAVYLESLGYIVEMLPSGATITREWLRRFDLVIRAGGYGTYTTQEIEAYKDFLNRNSSLLLISDHSAQLQNDQLAAYLGLQFEGNYTTDITQFNAHPITQGVSSHRYIAGSVIRNPDPNKITPLGFITDANLSKAAAMGIVHHPSSRIFFIGDINGLQTVPQPFTNNLFKWLSR